MEKNLGELLRKVVPPQSLQEALAAYAEIELTPDEHDQAILSAKIKKKSQLDEAARKLADDARRNAYKNLVWDHKQIESYMQWRAQKEFGGQFVLDKSNISVYELLLCYFTKDPVFFELAKDLKVEAPSLDKGIMLAGNTGTGKSWMMRLFSQNSLQCYVLANAKHISNRYEEAGQHAIDVHTSLIMNAAQDAKAFYQSHRGLCIDDMGAEPEVTVHMGNRKQVIGDIVELRYDKKITGVLLHLTSNLTGEEIAARYGPRVLSRLCEIVNFIELPGPDRRK